MAPKTHTLSHGPSKEEQEREPSSDEESGSEAESSGEETEEGSSENEDQKTLRNNKPQIPVPKSESKPIPQQNGSDSDPDSESVSPSNYKLQPIRKPSTTTSSTKRIHPEGDSSEDPSRSSKKSKVEEKRSSSITSGGGITRLWSTEDEIAVLKGLIDYRKLEGLDPNSEGFYNFIKGKLQDNFSKEQLRTKIGRLKRRFKNALKKGDPVFTKPHEDMAFELSKKIWGDAINNFPVSVKNEDVKKDTVKAEKFAVDENAIVMNEGDGEEGDFWSKYPYLSLSFKNISGNFPSLAMSEAGANVLKERVSLIGNAKAKEFNEKWRQLIVEEAELNYKMLALMTEQVRMALNQ